MFSLYQAQDFFLCGTRSGFLSLNLYFWAPLYNVNQWFQKSPEKFLSKRNFGDSAAVSAPEKNEEKLLLLAESSDVSDQ